MSFLVSAEDVAKAGAVVVSKARKAKPIAWASEVLGAIDAGSVTLPFNYWNHKSHGLRFQREFKTLRPGFRLSVEKMILPDGSVGFVRLNKVRDA